MTQHIPVTHPGHNLVEVCKELLLLYAHLKHPERRCIDCIGKHFLQILAYLDEMPSLDLDQEYKDEVDVLRPRCQNLLEAWGNGVDPEQIAEDLRRLRKAIQPAAVQIIASLSQEGAQYYPEPQLQHPHQHHPHHHFQAPAPELDMQEQMCPSCGGGGCSTCGGKGAIFGPVQPSSCQCGGRGCSLCARGCA